MNPGKGGKGVPPENSVLCDYRGFLRITSTRAWAVRIPASQLGPFRGQGHGFRPHPPPLADPDELSAREALGLGTDLGGYAIMVGGTNGPHLNSFSFVDVLAHGRACAILLPYYTVLLAPAIERQLHVSLTARYQQQ